MKLSSHLKVADLLSTLSADFPESVVRQSEATFDRLTLYAFKVNFKFCGMDYV